MERGPDLTSAETMMTRAMAAVSASSSSSHVSPTVDEGRFVPGSLLAGRYRIIALLGRGGMGEVYRATDLMLGQPVALKFLPEQAASNEFLLERFRGEVRVARQVSHPNVCRIYDLGEVDGIPFISMEYVDGEDLSSLLERIGRLPADKAVEAARQICAGIAAAHDKGVIHRDLKPQNIMMNRRGQIVIMDFGLAAAANQITGAEARHGTPAYMSPEQLRGTEVSARSDIYALGLVLYELFTGKRPFDAKTVRELIDQQDANALTSMTSIAAEIDPAVEKVVRRCLDPDPLRRPATALAVSAALPGGDPLAAALAAGETPSPDMVAAAGKTEGMERKYAVPCLAIALLCLIAAPIIKQKSVALFRTQTEDTPDVLRHKGRQIAEEFGYTDRPADSWVSLVQRQPLLAYLSKLPAPKHTTEWLASEAPVVAFYREARTQIGAAPTGAVTLTNPPPTDPGMVQMQIDIRGKLLGFAGVPIAKPPDHAVPVEAVFHAAQLDISRFTEVPPRTVPPNPAEELHAWRGPHPVLPNTQGLVEIATWKGRITSVRIFWPWSSPAAGTGGPPPWINRVRNVVILVLGTAGFLLASLLAHRNWRRGRADRRGAVRLGLLVFVLDMLRWAGTFHPLPTGDTVALFFNAFSDSLYGGFVFWLLYLALEPALRARWPHSIVTWNRVLTGKWRDAQVGAHVLIGAVVGMGFYTALTIFGIFQFGEDLDTVAGLESLMGPRHWMAVLAANLWSGLLIGIIFFFGVFCLRLLVRNDWLAGLIAALLAPFVQSNLNTAANGNLALAFGIFVALYGVLIFVMLRFGLVTAISATFFLNTTNTITMGTDLSQWYAPTGLATIAVILGITLFAFRQSLGSRELLGGDEAAG
jgi:serine/threonine-protein kinase